MEIIEAIETELRDETMFPNLRNLPASHRDPDDRWVLASAIDGRADLLVTGDQDLPTIASQAPLPSWILAAAGIACAGSDTALQK